MLELFDNLPVIELPDGRRALVDTGCNGAGILTEAGGAPVVINGNAVEPTASVVDLKGIAKAIGAPGLDMLIGASLLSEGFTVDLENGAFTFGATGPLPNQEVLAVLPYSNPKWHKSGIKGVPAMVGGMYPGASSSGLFARSSARKRLPSVSLMTRFDQWCWM